MLAGSTGIGYVLAGVPAGITPVSDTGIYLAGQVSAPTGSNPGGSYSDTVPSGDSPIDMSSVWLDGSVDGDKILISYNQR
jgi:hypothetical protein